MIDATGNGPATGIAALGLHFPSLALPVADLARLRGVDPNKYTVGLDCQEMALCPQGVGVVDLATEAARRALARWGGDTRDIGLLAVGTETGMDMSRPVSAWVADRLGIRGSVRSYEVKHACYGGTLALRQAFEWRRSGAARGKVALVIAADVALYGANHAGEPTQGAGAVAMLVGEPVVATLHTDSHAWSEPVFDFWRPVGDAYPKVDGPLSQDAYARAASECFKALVADGSAADVLDTLHTCCFHIPFPKMVKKAVQRIALDLGLSEDQAQAFYAHKVEPAFEWNRRVGNCYTASLWVSVARALVGLAAGEKVSAFSYGSGFGAELLILEAGPAAAAGAWAQDFTTDMASRTNVSGADYELLLAGGAHGGTSQGTASAAQP